MGTVIEWRVKDSLFAYMRSDASFAVVVDGGASVSDEGLVELPAAERDGAVVANASATLSAHGGALAVPLVDAVIEDGALWVRDPLDDEGGRLRLLQLDPDPGDPDAFGTRLAPEADILFLYNYAPGTPFGALRVVRDASESTPRS